MALEEQGRQSAAATQEALLSGGEDLFRRLLGEVVQEAVEKEYEKFMGAAPWQRSASRRGWRNGYKRRCLRTRVGTLELRIPKDREGQFQPSLFARYQRSEKALVLALVEMYIQGVSTRKVTRVVEELCGFRVSASQVSGLVKKLDAELESWRKRDLGDLAYLVGHVAR